VRLSWAQAMDVATRMNPGTGQVLVFSGDGSVLHSWYSQLDVSQKWGEVYSCRRDEAVGVVVARVTGTELDGHSSPAYGLAW
jgi:hypothetical protein